MLFVNATEMKNCFGKYLKKVMEKEEIYVVKHNMIVARFVPVERENRRLSAELWGIGRRSRNEDTVR